VAENNFAAFELLLFRGASPVIANDQGTSVLSMLMKRDLVKWADLAVKDLSDADKKVFVNGNHKNGNGSSVLHKRKRLIYRKFDIPLFKCIPVLCPRVTLSGHLTDITGVT
jgi:hypothetical protein